MTVRSFTYIYPICPISWVRSTDWWLLHNINPSEICAGDYLTQCHPSLAPFPNVTRYLAQLDRLDRFFIYNFQSQNSRVCTHMTKIIEFVTLLANFSQAPRKCVRESSNVECCPLRTQWSGTSMELGLVINTHNTPPGLTRQIAIKSPQSTDLHRWYLTYCGLNALHYYYYYYY